MIQNDFIFSGLSKKEISDSIKRNLYSLYKLCVLKYKRNGSFLILRISFDTDELANKDFYLGQFNDFFERILKKHFIGKYELNLPLLIQSFFNKNNLSFCCSESCTGGYISSLITQNSGCSSWFKGSVIAYSNFAKNKLLKVDNQILELYGAVSKEVVEEMAKKTLNLFKADYSLSVSGIAGPAGGSIQKPVGTVWISVASKENTYSKILNLGNLDRKAIIRKTSFLALQFLLQNVVESTH